ncbi:hypothetical protein [Trichlorobacter lovleyi]|uniref:hypothetical protein n=1 Tax=Trichlorobacter lovleyi TaxID=313985 RepID=UPI003D0B8081
MTQPTGHYTWRCNQCGSKLTDQQVKVYQQKLMHHGLDVGSCSLCGGHATNLEQLQKQQDKQRNDSQQEKRQSQQNWYLLLVSSALLIAMPGLLVFVVFVLVNLQFGMLKFTHIKMKMGAIILTGVACFIAVLAGAAGFISIGLIIPGNGLAGWLGSLMVWGFSLTVMFSMGMLIEKSGSMGGRLYY